MRLLALTTLAVVGDAARLTIDPMKHSVSPVTRSDFDAVINKFRDKQISVVYYYKPADADSAKYFDGYNQVATELRGMFKFAAVNCEDQAKLCKDENASEFPTVVVYPVRPFPAEPIPREDLSKLADEKGLKKTLYRMLSSEHVTQLTNENLDTFQAHEEHLPKVILFSNKKGVPPLFKSLSIEFHKEMEFGFFSNPSEDNMKKFKVKSLPRIVLQESNHNGKRQTQIYDGDLTFQAIHDWVNLRRQTFARGGGFDHTQSGSEEGGAKPAAPARPWMTQEIPEVYKASHKDVCFRFDEGLCVIFLKDGEVSESETAMLKKIKASVADETIKFRFMWMDLSKETGFRELFGAESLPNVVIFNPHKRMRFAGPVEDAANKESVIKGLIEKIIAGEGRFKVVPGQQLPAFADRKAATEQKKEEL